MNEATAPAKKSMGKTIFILAAIATIVGTMITIYKEFEGRFFVLNNEVNEVKKEINNLKDLNALVNILIKEKEYNKLANRADVIDLFQPFIAKGYMKIKFNGGQARWYKDSESSPLSYSKLQRYGAFKTHRTLLKIANHAKNDRPPWPLPPPKNGDEYEHELREKFELFNSVAPIWVKSGLLAD